MRRPARRIVAGVTAAIAVGALAGVPAAEADFKAQFKTVLAKAVANCHQRANTKGHGACKSVKYVKSGITPARPNSRFFRFNLRFSNHTCPAEYRIDANNHIFYANWAGACF